MSAPASKQTAVTVLVTRRARTGHVPEFERANEGMMAAAREFAGHLGGYMIRPSDEDGAEAGLYHVVFAFDTEAHLAAWQRSDVRAHRIHEMAPHTETESSHRRIPGLEHWFAIPGAPRPPPRWKVALVTWLGICPTVWIMQTALAPLLGAWPSFPRVMLMTALAIAAMTWLVAPFLTRQFAHWLYARDARHPHA